MYKVMVVDDDAIVRLSIKSLIDWQKYGFSVDYEAVNGKNALDIFLEHRDIDVVITDISMPFMNGIELIEKIKENGNSPAILVLSSYGDYTLVRDAFRLGINDYIMKSDIDSDSLLRLMLDIEDFLKVKAKSIETEGKKALHELYRKDDFLMDLLTNDITDSIIKRSCQSDIKIYKDGSMCVCALSIDDFNKKTENHTIEEIRFFRTSVCNTIEQVLSIRGVGEFISLSPQEYILFFSLPEIDELKIKSLTYEILKDIRHQLNLFLNFGVSIGISFIGTSLGSIKDLYHEAVRNVGLKYVFGKNRNINPSDTLMIKSIDSNEIYLKTKPILDAIKSCQEEQAVMELTELLSILDLRSFEVIQKEYYLYMGIIIDILKYLNETGDEVMDVFDKNIDFYETITRFETREEVNIWITNIVRWVTNYYKDKKSFKIGINISKACEFIKKNFTDENISVKTVSRYVGLSENHFISLFTKAMGMTFVEYLTNLRINNAKKLLEESDLKIYEICEKVGYRNIEHFSRIFKKVTGMSPKQYK